MVQLWDLTIALRLENPYQWFYSTIYQRTNYERFHVLPDTFLEKKTNRNQGTSLKTKLKEPVAIEI